MDPKQADEVLELTRRNDLRARELLKHLTSSLPDVRNENYELQQQLKDGRTEEEIRKSWEPALGRFRDIRKKYLLYAE